MKFFSPWIFIAGWKRRFFVACSDFMIRLGDGIFTEGNTGMLRSKVPSCLRRHVAWEKVCKPTWPLRGRDGLPQSTIFFISPSWPSSRKAFSKRLIIGHWKTSGFKSTIAWRKDKIDFTLHWGACFLWSLCYLSCSQFVYRPEFFFLISLSEALPKACWRDIFAIPLVMSRKFGSLLCFSLDSNPVSLAFEKVRYFVKPYASTLLPSLPVDDS